MGSLGAASSSFHVLDDTRPDDKSLPAFMVSTTRGFLPRGHPVVDLPSEFAPLDDILKRMPIKKLDGTPGLLADSKFGDAVLAELPDLTEHVDKYKDDLPLMNALYRDYSFAASAYLLEPCHERFVKGEPYGLGRQVLPRCIARPIARCAEITGFKPFIEYASGYALANYRLEDPKLGMDYDNLRLIRAFEHGLDPTSSEAGFVLVHIEMVKNSGPLVKGAMSLLDLASETHQGRLTLDERVAMNASLASMLAALQKINAAMETMWAKSRPNSYTSFRTFIFGITSQPMFPNGVVYEGVGDEKPMAFRGESGANDSIVPLMDNVLQISMPDTPLTAILRDFREYRPSNHRAFLAFVQQRSIDLDIKRMVLAEGVALPSNDEAAAAIKESRGLWIKLLSQVREFRWRHWCFAREYILKKTSHPTATGGSPIVTWLPNQLQAVLAEMDKVYDDVAGAEGEWALGEEVADIMDLVRRQKDMLTKEVDKYCSERGVKRD
ncbi:indoleamine 2,3-dioxygenase family protein [Plectosphaerella cucumerina]|uniref:Indoleamine 2,3-dioxygenase family protein n=1 Tax=Plectosphaerella cucumerina TaxID=40658 RepID=A0A8K0TSS6_9PEZI|nr:indoleamine 2,3-dioxygenase family protein [Plectosphaerella cucumerina]